MDTIERITPLPEVQSIIVPSVFNEDLDGSIRNHLQKIRNWWVFLGVFAFLAVIMPSKTFGSFEWILISAPFFIYPVLCLIQCARSVDSAKKVIDNDKKTFFLLSAKRGLKHLGWYFSILIISVLVLIAAFFVLIISSGGFHR